MAEGRPVYRPFSQLPDGGQRPLRSRFVQYPGERAAIDGAAPSASGNNILQVGGAYTWYWAVEIMSSDPHRVSATNDPNAPDLPRGGGVYTDQTPGHPRLKFINLVIHDVANAFGWWIDATDSEIYGCILYYNGSKRADGQGTGNGIYSQNDTGIKSIRDTINFFNFNQRIQIYTQSPAEPLNNYHIQENTIFSNGASLACKTVTYPSAALTPPPPIPMSWMPTTHTTHSPTSTRASTSVTPPE